MVWWIKPDASSNMAMFVEVDPFIIDPATGKRLNDTEHYRYHETYRRFYDIFGKSGEPFPEPDIVPKFGYIQKSRKRFPTIITMNGRFCVQQPFIDLIESFEPGMNEFFPIKLVVEKTGEEMPVQYFLMNPLQVLESVVLDHPTVRVEHFEATRHEPEQYRWHFIKGKNNLFFHKDVVEGHHLWKDKGGGGKMIFASDEFVEACEKAKLTGLTKQYHYEEI